MSQKAWKVAKLEISEWFVLGVRTGGAGSPSYNALRMNYIINCGLSRDILFVSGGHRFHEEAESRD